MTLSKLDQYIEWCADIRQKRNALPLIFCLYVLLGLGFYALKMHNAYICIVYAIVAILVVAAACLSYCLAGECLLKREDALIDGLAANADAIARLDVDAFSDGVRREIDGR